MPLPPACKPNCSRTDWVYHPAGEGATYVRNGMEIKHKGYAHVILTTCKACGNFIGYIPEDAWRRSEETAAKKRMAKVAGADGEIDGVGV